MGVGGARIALHAELFPSPLSAKEAFFSILDNFVQGNFSGDKPPDPQIIVALLGDQCIFSGVSGQAVQPAPLASLKLSMAVYGQKLDGRPSG